MMFVTMLLAQAGATETVAPTEASPEATDAPAESAETAPDEDPAEDPDLGTTAIDPLLGEPYEPTQPGQVEPSSPYWDLEVMYHKEQHMQGAKLAEKRYAETKDPHLTLHVARFWYQHLEGDETMSKKERAEIYERMITLLDEGIAADPNDGHLPFARGVVMARLATAKGVLASLSMADDIEAAWLDSAKSGYVYHSIGTQEQLPCDAWLALGIYYRIIPDSWLIKMLAGVRGDLDRSLEMHNKSLKCSGPRIRTLKELGVTQLCIGQTRKDPAMTEAGKRSINQFLGIAPTMQAEVIDIKHGAKLLADPSLACGYSRDGQQELDEEQLKQ